VRLLEAFMIYLSHKVDFTKALKWSTINAIGDVSEILLVKEVKGIGVR
jgi:hypothetical protein